jgi:DNA-binding MarR family transcriptional regulator
MLVVMDEPPTWIDDLVTPALLSEARRRYGDEIRRALARAGCDDVPRAGARLLGGIARNGPGVGDMAARLGMTKQATSQLVDTLVLRGYLERRPDPDDRRRVQLHLTSRGEGVAVEIQHAVARVDKAWRRAAGAEGVRAARAALGHLVSLGTGDDDADTDLRG